MKPLLLEDETHHLAISWINIAEMPPGDLHEPIDQPHVGSWSIKHLVTGEEATDMVGHVRIK